MLVCPGLSEEEFIHTVAVGKAALTAAACSFNESVCGGERVSLKPYWRATSFHPSSPHTHRITSERQVDAAQRKTHQNKARQTQITVQTHTMIHRHTVHLKSHTHRRSPLEEAQSLKTRHKSHMWKMRLRKTPTWSRWKERRAQAY